MFGDFFNSLSHRQTFGSSQRRRKPSCTDGLTRPVMTYINAGIAAHTLIKINVEAGDSTYS